MKNMIEVKNFTKKFGSFTSVDNISFNVKEGSIFGLLGPNGAGKSTTINTLCTLINKSSGDLKINGYDVSKDKDKIREQIGIVFQYSTLDGRLTVEENIKFHCRFYNVPKNEIKNRIDFVLDLVNLEKWRNDPVNSLSGGMKRRVEIARGLVHYPKVLFLDEPTTGLDPQSRASIWNYIYKLQKEKNITIFLTTHYMDEAEVCNKVAIMDQGKIIAFNSPLNLKKKYTLNTVKISISENDIFRDYLDKNHINYCFSDNLFTIHCNELGIILEIISHFKAFIKDLQISKGTLNDVFLKLTGKRIRE